MSKEIENLLNDKEFVKKLTEHCKDITLEDLGIRAKDKDYKYQTVPWCDCNCCVKRDADSVRKIFKKALDETKE